MKVLVIKPDSVRYEVRGLTVVAISSNYGQVSDVNESGRFPRTRRGVRALVRDLRSRGYDVQPAGAA